MKAVKIILIVAALQVGCHAVEHTAQGKTAAVEQAHVGRQSNKRKLITQGKKQHGKKQKLASSAQEKISPIVLGNRTLTELQQIFPTVLAHLILQYGCFEDGEFIAYFNPMDGSYIRKVGHDQDVFSGMKGISVFGVSSDHLPIERTCKFSQEDAKTLCSNYSADTQLSGWDYEHIGNAVKRSCNEVSTQRCLVDYTCLYTIGDGIDTELISLARHAAFMMSWMLGGSNIAVCRTDSLAVRQGQRNSLLCGVPGMGPREFAQLLKNAALYFKSVHATLLGGSFVHGDYNAVVDRYARYQPLLDQVINDTTDSLALVFFNESMTLEACMGATPLRRLETAPTN